MEPSRRRRTVQNIPPHRPTRSTVLMRPRHRHRTRTAIRIGNQHHRRGRRLALRCRHQCVVIPQPPHRGQEQARGRCGGGVQVAAARAPGQEGGIEEALDRPWPEGEIGEEEEKGDGEARGGEEEAEGVDSSRGSQPSCPSALDSTITPLLLHAIDNFHLIDALSPFCYPFCPLSLARSEQSEVSRCGS